MLESSSAIYCIARGDEALRERGSEPFESRTVVLEHSGKGGHAGAGDADEEFDESVVRLSEWWVSIERVLIYKRRLTLLV